MGIIAKKRVSDALSYEVIDKEDGDKPLIVVNWDWTPVVIHITDGQRRVQTKPMIVPGDIYLFAQRLEQWVERLMMDDFPEVSSPVFEELNLLKELQQFSNKYIEYERCIGRDLEKYRQKLWSEFSSTNLDRLSLNRKKWHSLNTSFNYALKQALEKFQRKQLTRF